MPYWFSTRKRNKRLQKVVWVVLAVLLSIGLILPSFISFLPNLNGSNNSQQANQTAGADNTIKQWEAQAQQNPKDVNILNALAAAYANAGKLDQSAATYEKLLQIDSNDINARLNLVVVYSSLGKKDLADQQMQQAVKIAPENPQVHRQYANLLVQDKQDYSAAVSEMEKFIALQKTGPDVDQARQQINQWKAKAR